MNNCVKIRIIWLIDLCRQQLENVDRQCIWYTQFYQFARAILQSTCWSYNIAIPLIPNILIIINRRYMDVEVEFFEISRFFFDTKFLKLKLDHPCKIYSMRFCKKQIISLDSTQKTESEDMLLKTFWASWIFIVYTLLQVNYFDLYLF